MSLKDSWKKVGSDFKNMGKNGLGRDIGTTAKDFGKSVYKSVLTGAEKAGGLAEKLNDNMEKGEAAEAEKAAYRESQASDAAQKADKAAKICPACGEKLEEDAAFCPKCGKKIED